MIIPKKRITTEAATDEPSTDDAAESDANDAEVDGTAPNTNEEPEYEENHTNDNNLKAVTWYRNAQDVKRPKNAQDNLKPQQETTILQIPKYRYRDLGCREALKTL